MCAGISPVKVPFKTRTYEVRGAASLGLSWLCSFLPEFRRGSRVRPVSSPSGEKSHRGGGRGARGIRCVACLAPPSRVSACVYRGAAIAACWGGRPRPRAGAVSTASWSATSVGWSSGRAASRARRRQTLPRGTVGTSKKQVSPPFLPSGAGQSVKVI